MSGAVYQPTTVTYESSGPQERWRDSRPISYLANVSQTTSRPCGISCFPSRMWPIVLISSCIACFTIGIIMIVQGALNYADTTENSEQTSFDLCITIFGALFFAFSILLFVFFLRLTRRFCWRNTKTHNIDTAGNQALTVNPSTDLLVAAQYAPVSEVHYEQNNKAEETEEHRNLMSHENKELTNEDTDRMVENDPRIVLRPLNAAIAEEA